MKTPEVISELVKVEHLCRKVKKGERKEKVRVKQREKHREEG